MKAPKFKLGDKVQTKGANAVAGVAGRVYGILTTIDSSPNYLIEYVNGDGAKQTYIREGLLETVPAEKPAAKKFKAAAKKADGPAIKPTAAPKARRRSSRPAPAIL